MHKPIADYLSYAIYLCNTQRLYPPHPSFYCAKEHLCNSVRGHRALGDKPSITRINEEHSCAASPDVLDRLESFASQEIGRRMLPDSGSFRLFKWDAHVDAALAKQEVIFFETLEGLEARWMVKASPFFGITEPTEKRLSDSVANIKYRRFCVLSPCFRSGARELLSQLRYDPARAQLQSLDIALSRQAYSILTKEKILGKKNTFANAMFSTSSRELDNLTQFIY